MSQASLPDSDDQPGDLPDDQSVTDQPVADSSCGAKWKYERKPKPKKPDVTPGMVISDLFKHAALYVYFSLSPIFLLAVVHWIFKHMFADTFYGEPWMMPTILLFSTFFAGVFNRMVMEGFFRSMGLFLVAILGFCTFAVICMMDLKGAGSVFSARLLPDALRYSMAPFIYAIPVTGMLGMFMFKWFTLRP